MTARLIFVVSLLLPVPTVGHTQSATFTSKVEAVRVDVLVTNNGQPVLGLGPSDFEVLDDGIAQQIDLVSFDQIPLNVVLALDMSDSVAGDRLSRLRVAGGAVLAALQQEDQVALVTFSDVVQLAAKLTKNHELARAALDTVRGIGRTALIDGTYAGVMVGESDIGRTLLLLFTDGLDTSSWLSAEAVLNITKR